MTRYDLINYIDNMEYFKDQLTYLNDQKETVNKVTASYGLNAGGSSEIQDRMAENLAKLMDKYEEMQRKTFENQEKAMQVKDLLDKMEDAFHRNILYKKYILGKSTEEIAVEYHKTTEYMSTLHGYALKEFDIVCENFEK